MNSRSLQDVLITGVGVVSPIGIGCEAVWNSLRSRQSGVKRWPEMEAAGWMAPFCGAVHDFDGRRFVTPRKSLKVMCREMQFSTAAAELAWSDAGLSQPDIDPQRAGIIVATAGEQVCGLDEVEAGYRAWLRQGFDVNHIPRAMIDELYPLWMLKYLPNLNACHIGIRHGLLGPTNTVAVGDASSLTALGEAAAVIRRGTADLMIVGGVSSYVHVLSITFHAGARLSTDAEVPERACRPFDRHRTGMVYGEGAAFFVLESRAHAVRRGARPLAQVAAAASRYEACAHNQSPTGDGIRRAIDAAFQQVDIAPEDIGHVNAHGNSTLEDDPVEAQAIHDILGNVPVTAPKSFFGNLYAGSGAVELAVSLIGLEHGVVPPTLNYETPDDACPVNVITEPLPMTNRTFLALNHSCTGQAAAAILTQP